MRCSLEVRGATKRELVVDRNDQELRQLPCRPAWNEPVRNSTDGHGLETQYTSFGRACLQLFQGWDYGRLQASGGALDAHPIHAARVLRLGAWREMRGLGPMWLIKKGLGKCEKIGDCHKRRPRRARRINDIFSRG